MGLATAFDQAQHASRNQATHRLASGLLTETNMAGQPGHRKAGKELSVEGGLPGNRGGEAAADQGKVGGWSPPGMPFVSPLCTIRFFVFGHGSTGEESLHLPT